MSDTECCYSAIERETRAICWRLNELCSYISSSSVFIETDHEPLSNMHKKRTFRNKRVDNWPLKLQDILPQTIEIKYLKGIDNVGPDFSARYEFLASSSLSTSIVPTQPSTPPLQHISLLNISSLGSDWSWGTEAWDPIVLFPLVTRSKVHAKACLSHPLSVHQPSATFLPADTHQESFRVSSHVTLSRDSLPSANTTLDLSPSRIKTKQHSDPDVFPIINRLCTVPSDPQFALQDDDFLFSSSL